MRRQRNSDLKTIFFLSKALETVTNWKKIASNAVQKNWTFNRRCNQMHTSIVTVRIWHYRISKIQVDLRRRHKSKFQFAINCSIDSNENANASCRTLLLIIREMIGTERDYVRSLHYIIENYIEELNREDIPQALRGQRNVIFGNVEKICEFHQQYFLHELERCEKNPLKIGAVFLEHESKFYLYALYNKNKPKSDALMSEYGSSFFKVSRYTLLSRK